MEIVWFVITGILLWWIVIYNLLVRDKNRILAAWSDIDVQLKRRHDLIPKLVDAV
ncbi:MAG: LemA family protein, partial [Gammaproteobacteria bacterium]